MAIPGFQDIMLPFLKLASDKSEHSKSEFLLKLSHHFNLSQDDLDVILPSGRAKLFSNRLAWAKTYLKHAGLIKPSKRGCFFITPRGLDLLKENPDNISRSLLLKYPEFKDFINKPKEVETESEIDSSSTPEEILESSYKELRDQLSEDLLDNIKSSSPQFFEKLVVELLGT